MITELSDLVKTGVFFTSGFILGLTKYAVFAYKLQKRSLTFSTKIVTAATVMAYSYSLGEELPGYGQAMLVGLSGEYIGSSLADKLWSNRYNSLPKDSGPSLNPLTSVFFTHGNDPKT